MKPLKLSGYLGDTLSLIAGLSLPLAFAPYALFPIAVLSPALLFLLWQNISPRRAFWRGLLYGIGLFGAGVSWVHISFHQFGGLPLIGTITLTAGFVLMMALYPALLGQLLTRFFLKNTPIKLLVILPAAWTLMEWLRGWFLTGFPWLSLGYSQIDSPLNGFAPLLGVYGVSWLTVFTAALLVYAFNIKHLAWRILPVLLVIWGSGWLLSCLSWTQPIGKAKQVALIQGNIPQEFKWLSGFQVPSMQRYLELSKAHRDADIIIWPETAIAMFYNDVSIHVPGFLEEIVAEHTQYHTDFLIGLPVMHPNGDYFNSVASIGSQPGFYYKSHLVPFGEYIPFQSTFGELLKLLNVPLSAFSPGEAIQPNLNSANEKIGISICYEAAYGELIRNSLPSATLLVNVSNDAWFGDSIAPHQHLEIARMRALETGRYLLRTTNTGISAIINTQGKIVTQTPQFQITTLRAEAQPYQGSTPYIRFGNNLIITLLLITLIVGTLAPTLCVTLWHSVSSVLKIKLK